MWLSRVDGLDVATAESDEGISLLAAMAGKGTHDNGTQEWMSKAFLSILKSVKTADDGDIQIAAMLCSSKYEKLAKEQATRRERALELMGSGAVTECEKTAELTRHVVSLATEMETFFSKIVALAIRVATCTHLLVPADVKFLRLTAAYDSGV